MYHPDLKIRCIDKKFRVNGEFGEEGETKDVGRWGYFFAPLRLVELLGSFAEWFVVCSITLHVECNVTPPCLSFKAMASRQLVRPLARAVGPAAPRRTIFAGQDAWRKHPLLT